MEIFKRPEPALPLRATYYPSRGTLLLSAGTRKALGQPERVAFGLANGEWVILDGRTIEAGGETFPVSAGGHVYARPFMISLFGAAVQDGPILRWEATGLIDLGVAFPRQPTPHTTEGRTAGRRQPARRAVAS